MGAQQLPAAAGMDQQQVLAHSGRSQVSSSTGSTGGNREGDLLTWRVSILQTIRQLELFVKLLKTWREVSVVANEKRLVQQRLSG
jgi:hypothetical protein